MSIYNSVLVFNFNRWLLNKIVFFFVEVVAEKHQTSTLIKRQLAGVSLEDPEPEPLIKREKGKWSGLELFNLNLLTNNKLPPTPTTAQPPPPPPSISATINTLKTTLAHKNCSDMALLFHQVISFQYRITYITFLDLIGFFLFSKKYKRELITYLKYLETTQQELQLKSTKWVDYWAESITGIKSLYKN